MKRLCISSLALAVFAHTAIAQETAPLPPAAAPVPTAEMTMDKTPPEPDGPMPPSNSDMPADPAPQAAEPKVSEPPIQQATALAPGAAGAIIYQPSADTALPPAASVDYPLCSKTVKDSCRNPSESGVMKRAKK